MKLPLILLLVVTCVMGMFVCGGGLLLLLIPLQHDLGTRIELSDGSELYYSADVSQVEAERLANYLDESQSMMNSSNQVTYRIDKSDQRYEFGMVIQKDKMEDELVQLTCRLFAQNLSTNVFDNAPIDFHMCDRSMNTVRVLQHNEIEMGGEPGEENYQSSAHVSEESRHETIPSEEGAIDVANRIAELEGKITRAADGDILTIEFFEDPVNDDDLSLLAELQTLQKLTLRNAQISDAGLAALTGHETLHSLNLYGCDITDEGIRHISHIEGLRVLILSGDGISDTGLEHLAGMAHLEELAIFAPSATDAGLARLVANPALTRLTLTYCDITGEGLAALTDACRLERLQLIGCHIEDKFLPHLSRLTSLTWLDLSGSPLTDNAVDHLRPLRQLEYLTIRDTEISMERAAELDEALAATHVFDW